MTFLNSNLFIFGRLHFHDCYILIQGRISNFLIVFWKTRIIHRFVQTILEQLVKSIVTFILGPKFDISEASCHQKAAIWWVRNATAFLRVGVERLLSKNWKLWKVRHVARIIRALIINWFGWKGTLAESILAIAVSVQVLFYYLCYTT